MQRASRGSRLLLRAFLTWGGACLVAVLACGDDEGDRGDDGSTTATGATMTATTAPETSTDPSATAGTSSTGAATSEGTTAGTTVDPDTGTTAGTGTGPETGTDTGGTTGDPLGDCCTPHGTPGCSVPEIQDCVCMIDAPCCVGAWDNVCVGDVEKLRCADCTL
jgi:hypothetical protein